jgi:hypothetical protein
MADHDDDNNAEAFDEDLLVDEGADDTDVSSLFPPDHYLGVLDPAVTAAAEALGETFDERSLQEDVDPVVQELDRNALAEELEDDAHRRGLTGSHEPVDVQIAELDDALLDDEESSPIAEPR